jgi:hypothetical protein
MQKADATGKHPDQGMIPKSMPSGFDPMGGNRFSLGTNAKRLPGDHAQEKRRRRV